MNLDDPKLTAYALGELSDPAEYAEVEAWLATSEEGRDFVSASREMAALLSQTLQAESVPLLTADQRRTILGGGAPVEEEKSDKIVEFPDKAALAATTGQKVRRVGFTAALTALAACLALGPFLPWGELLRLQHAPLGNEVASSAEPTFKVAMAPPPAMAATPLPLAAAEKMKLAMATATPARTLLAEQKAQALGGRLDFDTQNQAKLAVNESAPARELKKANELAFADADGAKMSGGSATALKMEDDQNQIAAAQGAVALGKDISDIASAPQADTAVDRAEAGLASAKPAAPAADVSSTTGGLLASDNQLGLLLGEADRYVAEGRYDLALIRWAQILQLDPKNERALAGLAKYERAREQSLVASAYADKIRDKGSDALASNFQVAAPSIVATPPPAAKVGSLASASAPAVPYDLDLPEEKPVASPTAAPRGSATVSGAAGSVVASRGYRTRSATPRSKGVAKKAVTKDEELNSMAVSTGASIPSARSEGAEPVLGDDKDDGQPSGTGSFVKHLGQNETGNTESYDAITENPFETAKENPLSTFSIDVDTASYSNLRRFLNDGELPPTGAVRIEEMLNYFTYDYPAPTDSTPFSTRLEVSECPWQPEHRLVRVGLRGRDIPANQRPAGNLVFLIDVSGSMDEPNKLPLLKQSLRLLVDQLGTEDQVAMVVYAGNSGLVLPSTSDKEKIRAALDNLEAGGSTNGASGIQLAYQVARENFIKGGANRVILATDGDFNVGVTNQSDLVDMIKSEAKSGVFLTVLGFGTENLKDSTMEKLADKGNGNYAYIDSLNEGKKVLAEQLGGTLYTIAKDVKLQVEFNPAVVSAYRLIGYENRMLRKEDFNDDKKDAGEIGANIAVTALYEVVPVGSLVPVGAVDALRYSNANSQVASMPSAEMLTLKIRYKQPDSDTSSKLEFPLVDLGARMDRASTDFRFAAAIAEAGLLLRHSENKALASWDATIELAAHSLGDDHSGYRKEFVEMLRKARVLSQKEG